MRQLQMHCNLTNVRLPRMLPMHPAIQTCHGGLDYTQGDSD